MKRSGLAWCLAYSLVLAVLTSLPYLLATNAHGEDWQFTGFVFGVEDGHSYLAKMRRGAEGEWLFRSPYSTQPQRGVIAFTPYLLLGKLAGTDPAYGSLAIFFHAFRVFAIPAAVLASYRFIGLFVPSGSLRRLGTVLATLGGGLGWVTIAIPTPRWLESLALEFYSPESFGFLAIYGIPHLLLARAALLYALVWYLESRQERKKSWWSGSALLGLGLTQPIGLLVAAAAVVAHGIVLLGASPRAEWRREARTWLTSAVRAYLIPAPFMLYLAFAFLTDSYLQSWAAQNLIPSPPPAIYLLAYGLMAVPAALGAWTFIRRSDAVRWMAVAWVVAAPALAYAPFTVQRRLTEGVWVALVALAVQGLCVLRSRWRRPAIVSLLLLSLPSSIILLAAGFAVGRLPGPPAYRSIEETGAFQAFAEESRLGEVALASYFTGNALPAWAPVQVPIGHGPESARSADLEPRVVSLFDQTTEDAARIELLSEVGADYLFYGPHEAALGSWDPSEADFLSLQFERDGFSVYEFGVGG